MAIPADGDLPFLHRFQQSRLCFGWRAVDLVGQDHVGKQRALPGTVARGLRSIVLLDDLGPRDVGRHQVGCELDAAER